MRKIFLIASVFAATIFCSYGQDNNDQNGDDVYYESDNNNAAPAPVDANGNDQAPTYQQFYDQLSPYGQWINYPGYGYCWVPNQLPADFSPYMTGGHWVYTDYGMTWVSDYGWGWAAFHYGRWFQDPSYGWMWVPGYDWAPAWVMWGDYGGYYCWAPFGPGVIISPHYRPDPNWWHFCERGHIMDEHFDHYAIRNEQFESQMHFTRADINNHISFNTHANTYNQGVFFSGPKAEEIQKYSGHPVTKVTVNNTSHAGATHVENNQLNIYRPNIQRTNKQPAPANAKNTQDIHPINNNSSNRPNNEQPQQNNRNQRAQQPTPAPRASQQPAQQRQVQPERNFIPSERPAQPAPQRSAPEPTYRGGTAPSQSFHSSGGMGGGGGGRH